MKCQVDAIQWGGGSSRIFNVVSQNPTPLSGGGGSSRTFPWSPKANATRFSGGDNARTFPLMGPFDIFTLNRPLTVDHLIRAPSVKVFSCTCEIIMRLATTHLISSFS